MTVHVEALPIPELLWVERDDTYPDRVQIAVRCPLCFRTHRHDAHITERAPARVPHCLRRLDETERVYTIDVGSQR